MQKANEVGLNEDIASAVRGGASNIWDYSDDTVRTIRIGMIKRRIVWIK